MTHDSIDFVGVPKMGGGIDVFRSGEARMGGEGMKMRKMRRRIVMMINELLVKDGLSLDASRTLSRIIGN